MTDIVAIQQIGMFAKGMKFLFHQVGNGRFARSRQPGEPENRRLLPFLGCPRRLVNIDGLPMDIFRPAQRKVDHPGGNSGIAEAVNKDKGAGFTDFGIRIKGDRLVNRDVADTDFIQFQRFGGRMLHRVYIDLVFQAADAGSRGTRTEFEGVGPAGQHGFAVHPDDLSLELIGGGGAVLRLAKNVAAADINFIGKRQGYCLAGNGLFQVAIHGDNAGYLAALPRGRFDDCVADPDAPAGDGAGKAAKIKVGPVDPLHRETERAFQAVAANFDGLQMFQNRRAVIPRHGLTRADHVIPIEG